MISITYHDVVAKAEHEKSGFANAWAAIYKLEPDEFERHLEAIRRALGGRTVGNSELNGVCLTFDDGGASAYVPVSSLLERYGWRGYFFVTTDWIGKPGFLTEDQLRELDRRGHVIGSHSCSHPRRMAALSQNEILEEWTGSTKCLARILGHPVTTASVPGGYYSQHVAQAAAEAGIHTLFTSEPTTAVRMVNGCRVLGRYVVQQGMGPAWSAGFAAGDVIPRLRQAALWKAKGAAKRLGGRLYVRIAERIIGSRSSSG